MALAQRPTFDPNNRSTMADKTAWQNRVFTHGFEPGSMMKCIAIAGALDYGVVTLDDVYDCENGYWVYARRPLRDSGHRFGLLRVWEIVQKSSNIGTAKIALDMGKRRLYQTFLRFGFGQRTGIGFPREATGIFRPIADWDGLSITRFPIGQGILVTPLQLVQTFCALANDGLMMKPYLVDRKLSHRPGGSEFTRPEPARRAVRPEAARTILQAMKLVTMEGGTAPQAAVAGYEVAGKTGTAQKYVYDENGKGYYSHSRYIAGFIGIVPADKPAFVLLIVADEPSRGGHYGGIVAAPSFSRIAAKVLRYLQVPPATMEEVSHVEREERGRNDGNLTISDIP